MLEINKGKFDTFIEIARHLNKHNITPMLYGSLGLNHIIGEKTKSSDIDLLIDDSWLGEGWLDLKKVVEELEFVLTDEHEHEFTRAEEIVAFAKESDLEKLCGIKPDEVNIVQEEGAEFRILNPEQYLVCYKNMLRDDYRQEKKGGADQEKIKAIEEFLAKQE